MGEDPKDYIEIAIALATLAYHDKNYLPVQMNDCNLNIEIRYLLDKALGLMKKAKE